MIVPGIIASARYGYTAVGSDYDGTNDYQKRGGGLTGAADNKKGTLSCWVRSDSQLTQRIFTGVTLLNGNVPRFEFFYDNATDKFYIDAYNSSGTLIMRIRNNSTFAPNGEWQHVMAAWDMSLTRQFYFNGVSDISNPVFTNDNIDYTLGDWSIGAYAEGTNKMDACISELFFHNDYLPLTEEANRLKFRSAAGKPVFMGLNGELPFGVTPLVYVPTGDASGSGNKGSGGAFTTVGSLDVCASSPST